MGEVKAGESLAELCAQRYCSPSHHVPASPIHMRSFVRLLLAAAAVPAMLACGETLRLPAQGEVFGDTLTVYALSGTDISYPSALNVGGLVVVRVSGVFDYEIAFDIDAAGNTVIYPIALLAAEELGVRRVGLQKVAGTFAELTEAPRTGYVYDEALVVTPGEVVVIEAGVSCPYPYPQMIYAKLSVDSVSLVRRAIHFQAVTDPSCGFRSFLPGIPRR